MQIPPSLPAAVPVNEFSVYMDTISTGNGQPETLKRPHSRSSASQRSIISVERPPRTSDSSGRV